MTDQNNKIKLSSLSSHFKFLFYFLRVNKTSERSLFIFVFFSSKRTHFDRIKSEQNLMFIVINGPIINMQYSS